MKMINVKKITGLCVATAMIGAAITPTFASVSVSQNGGARQIVIDNGNVSVVSKESCTGLTKDCKTKGAELRQEILNRVDEIKNMAEKDKSKISYSIKIDIRKDSERKTETTTKAKGEATTEAATEATTQATTEATTEAATEATTQATTESKKYSDYVTAVVELTNAARAKNNLPALELSDDLCRAAQDHANDMSENEYFSHTSKTGDTLVDRVRKYNSDFCYMGENIARGQSTAEEVVNDWLNSEGHRANIMNETYTKIGIGYCDGYWVQDFAE
jgi:uncharacterized protein YkwD